MIIWWVRDFFFPPRKKESEALCFVIPFFMQKRLVIQIGCGYFSLSYLSHTFVPFLRASTVCHLMSVIIREWVSKVHFTVFSFYIVFHLVPIQVKRRISKGQFTHIWLAVLSLLITEFIDMQDRLKTHNSFLLLHKRNVAYTSCIGRD